MKEKAILCGLITLFFLQFQVRSQAQDDLNMNKMIGAVDSENIFRSDSFYNWCSTVIKGDDGKYHMFYARWPHGERKDTDDSLNYIFNGFRGWNKYSEIAYAVSDNINGPYHYVQTVLKGTGDKSRPDRFTYHNPHIRFFDGYYYLYFISNSFDSSFTLNKPTTRQNLQWLRYNCTQKVFVIKVKTIDGLLNNAGVKPTLLMEPDNKKTFEVATNPTVTQGPDGRYYMMYKSRRPNVGHMTFWMAVADKPDGPFETVSAVLNSADMACEDPTIWYDKKRKRFYAAAKYYSGAKKLAPQFGALVLITSKDGFQWQPAKHSLVSLKELNFKNGSRRKLANLERPFVVTDKNGQPVTLFAAAAFSDPFKGDVNNVPFENNTFIVQIPLE